MASPSNKTTGKTYLEKNFNKEQLIDRILMQEAQLFDSEEKYNKLFSELAETKKTLNTLQRKLDRLNTEDDIIKKILEFRARTMSPIKVLEKLKLEGIEKVSLQKIKDIINTELSIDNQLFFDKCRKAYIESLQINTTLYKQSSIDEIQCLIDSAQEDLMNADVEDVKIRSSLRSEIANYTEKRDKLMKNIDENVSDKEEEIILNESMEEFKSFTANIFNFNSLGVIEKIGGEDE